MSFGQGSWRSSAPDEIRAAKAPARVHANGSRKPATYGSGHGHAHPGPPGARATRGVADVRPVRCRAWAARRLHRGCARRRLAVVDLDASERGRYLPDVHRLTRRRAPLGLERPPAQHLDRPNRDAVLRPRRAVLDLALHPYAAPPVHQPRRRTRPRPLHDGGSGLAAFLPHRDGRLQLPGFLPAADPPPAAA